MYQDEYFIESFGFVFKPMREMKQRSLLAEVDFIYLIKVNKSTRRFRYIVIKFHVEWFENRIIFTKITVITWIKNELDKLIILKYLKTLPTVCRYQITKKAKRLDYSLVLFI